MKELNPAGYHILVRGGTQEEISLANNVVGKPSGGKFFPYIPFYVIVDKHGNIVGKPNANPSLAELQPDSKENLYNKLDSVRAL